MRSPGWDSWIDRHRSRNTDRYRWSAWKRLRRAGESRWRDSRTHPRSIGRPHRAWSGMRRCSFRPSSARPVSRRRHPVRAAGRRRRTHRKKCTPRAWDQKPESRHRPTQAHLPDSARCRHGSVCRCRGNSLRPRPMAAGQRVPDGNVREAMQGGMGLGKSCQPCGGPGGPLTNICQNHTTKPKMTTSAIARIGKRAIVSRRKADRSPFFVLDVIKGSMSPIQDRTRLRHGA